jgi:hypothetical protein
MERVNAAANAFGAGTYSPGFVDVDGLTESDLADAQSSHNWQWMNRLGNPGGSIP